MKAKIQLAALVLVSSFILHPSSLLAQGSLTPPGAPAPTMKTLDQLDAKLEMRTPISSLPYSIATAGSYYVTSNLTGVSGNDGINIISGNVSVDLNGFTLTGVSGSGAGIYVAGTFTNITVRNGTINSWGSDGINAWLGGFPRNMVFERLTVSANGARGIYTEADSTVRDCLCFSNHSDGIYDEGGLISGCLARQNGGDGIYGGRDCSIVACSVVANAMFGIVSGDGSGISHCTAGGNGTDGIKTGNGSTVSDCTAESNTNNGIVVADDSTVRDCTSSRNGYSGIVSGSRCQILNNNSSLNGIPASASSGIYLNGNYNRVEGNNVVSNNFAGIFSSVFTGGPDSIFHHNLIVRNSAHGNAVDFQVDSTDTYGPIVTGAGVITTNNPWANFSF